VVRARNALIKEVDIPVTSAEIHALLQALDIHVVTSPLVNIISAD
jgi:hypothetical protein